MSIKRRDVLKSLVAGSMSFPGLVSELLAESSGQTTGLSHLHRRHDAPKTKRERLPKTPRLATARNVAIRYQSPNK
jgi:hypothetical protein